MFRIDVFDNQGNYKKNFSAGFPINDMVINDKCEIILPALKNNKIMHAYSLEGEPISSFGEPLKPADELIQYKNFPNLQIPSRLFFTANKNICFIGLSKYVVYAYRQEKSVGTIDSDSPYFIPVSVIKGRREGSYSFMVPTGSILEYGRRMINPVDDVRAEIVLEDALDEASLTAFQAVADKRGPDEAHRHGEKGNCEFQPDTPGKRRGRRRRGQGETDEEEN